MQFDSSRKRPRTGEGGRYGEADMDSWEMQQAEADMEYRLFRTPSPDIPEPELTHHRILLLGRSESGKSAAGNIILGNRVFAGGRQCQVNKGHYGLTSQEAEYPQGYLTVVESPGWYRNSPLQGTSEMVKLEIQNSVSHCFPGPHAVLLVVPLNTAFTKAQRVALEEHMTLLSETVWSHTIVLFTYGDYLRNTSIEQHIEAQGEDLRWLVDKCGNRYHVFNYKKSNLIEYEITDSAQKAELLEKIYVMVAGNGFGHYEDDGDVSEKVSERMRNIVEHAQTLMAKTQRQRTALKALFKGKHPSLPAVRVMLVGGEQDQRSKAGDIILRKFTPTPLQETKLTECVRQQRRVGETNVSVVICPDWSTTPPSQKIKEVLQRGVTLCSPGPHVVLLSVPVRSSFSEADRRSVEEHMELLWDGVWKQTLVLFTQEYWLGGRPVEEYIESEGEPLKWLLEKCGYRYNVLTGSNSELIEKIEGMVMNRGHFGSSDSREGRSVGDTGHFKTECYTLSRNPRGRCLIINNEMFTVDWLQTRHGTRKDQEALDRVFSRLGFEVEVHHNKTASEIRCVLGDLGKQDFTEADALVVCVLTHGSQGCVLGTDGGKVLLQELKQPFTSDSAPTLAGKPKLFFIQACQGKRRQQVLHPRSSFQEDGLSVGESVALYADFLTGMATVEEFVTMRNVNTGSIYIQELCRQLEAAAAADSGEDIHSVLTAVNREVGKGEYPFKDSYCKLMPECRHTLTKKLVLNFI